MSNARLLLDPPADKLSLAQAEFSMDGICGITLGKCLKCSVGFVNSGALWLQIDGFRPTEHVRTAVI